jgi:hypothetical protein
MPPAGFEPAIPANEHPQTYFLEHGPPGLDSLISSASSYVFCYTITVYIQSRSNGQALTAQDYKLYITKNL